MQLIVKPEMVFSRELFCSLILLSLYYCFIFITSPCNIHTYETSVKYIQAVRKPNSLTGFKNHCAAAVANIMQHSSIL